MIYSIDVQINTENFSVIDENRIVEVKCATQRNNIRRMFRMSPLEALIQIAREERIEKEKGIK